MTPEQMRALANRAHESLEFVGDGDWTPQDTLLVHVIAALRAAADQLEAVQKMHHEREWRPLDGTYIGGTYCNHCRRPWPCSTYQAATADTAPQETYAQRLDRQSREAVEKKQWPSDVPPQEGRDE